MREKQEERDIPEGDKGVLQHCTVGASPHMPCNHEQALISLPLLEHTLLLQRLLLLRNLQTSFLLFLFSKGLLPIVLLLLFHQSQIFLRAL